MEITNNPDALNKMPTAPQEAPKQAEPISISIQNKKRKFPKIILIILLLAICAYIGFIYLKPYLNNVIPNQTTKPTPNRTSIKETLKKNLDEIGNTDIKVELDNLDQSFSK